MKAPAAWQTKLLWGMEKWKAKKAYLIGNSNDKIRRALAVAATANSCPEYCTAGL